MPRAPRLAELARQIEAEFPDLRATLEPWSYTPYRKPKGLRYRTWEGKTRRGHRLAVYDRATGRRVWDHNPLEPYRRNADVLRWLADERARRSQPEARPQGHAERDRD